VEVPGLGSPAKITVGGPVGTELIKVIASTKSRQIFQQTTLQPAGPWQTVSVNVPQWTRDLSLTMQGQPGAVTTVSTVAPAVTVSQPVVATTSTHVVETGEWDGYNKVIRTVPAPAGFVAAPSVVIVPGAPPAQQVALVPAGSVPAVVWTHAVTAPGPLPLVLSMTKPSFSVGEVVPLQVAASTACNLLITAGGNQPIYPASGQPVLIQANQPVVINGITAQVSQTLVATCVPVTNTRDAGDTVLPVTAQIAFTVQ
jgi:hypothetical protein